MWFKNLFKVNSNINQNGNTTIKNSNIQLKDNMEEMLIKITRVETQLEWIIDKVKQMDRFDLKMNETLLSVKNDVKYLKEKVYSSKRSWM